MYIWTDLETTGLSPTEGSILEIAVVVTDFNLHEIGEPFVSLVCPRARQGYDAMDSYVREMHAKSGLLEHIYQIDRYGNPTRVIEEVTQKTTGEVRTALLAWFEQFIPAAVSNLEAAKFLRKISFAGSSVHFDKAWLKEHMPDFESLFSHRILDVSSINMLAEQWAPEIHSKRPGLGPDGKPVPMHRALDDIRNSIETLRYYRKSGFIGGVVL